MKKYEKQNRKVDVVNDVICDICGESCKVREGIVDNEVREDHGEMHYSFEYMTLSAHWGYHSKHDLEEWDAEVCEKCVVEKLSELINFDVSRYLPGMPSRRKKYKD